MFIYVLSFIQYEVFDVIKISFFGNLMLPVSALSIMQIGRWQKIAVVTHLRDGNP